MVGDETHRVVEADNPVGAVPNERVAISVAPGAALGAGAIVYVMPIAALILGAVAGTRLAGRLALPVNPDLSGALLGLTGLVLSVFLVRAIDSLARRRKTFRPTITKVVEEHVQGEGSS
jgi:positive regulator of sigma E activity